MKSKIFYETDSFTSKVKERFHDQTHIYYRFHFLMQNFYEQRLNTETIISNVEHLFNGHSDLILGFKYFIQVKFEGMDEFFDQATKVSIEFINKVRNTLQNDQKFKVFVDALNHFDEPDDIEKAVSVLFKNYPELEIELSKFLADIVESKSGNKDADFTSFFAKSFIHGGEIRKKNPYEKIMFECEDEMYEHDMKLHSVESAKNAALELENQVSMENPNEGINIEERFSALNLRHFKVFYGDKYPLVKKMLKKKPEVASGLLVRDMEEEHKKCLDLYKESKSRWAKTFKDNHEKALNHQPMSRRETGRARGRMRTVYSNFFNRLRKDRQ